MRSFLLSLAALATAAAGLYAATIVAPARATTVSLGDLPGLGYTLALRADLSSSPPCSNYWVTGGNGAPETLIGDPSHLACTTPEEMQARIDALLAAFPPTPATTTDPQTVFVTTTVYDTTTVTSTETLPVTTTAYDTTTVTLPAPAPVTTTLATTVTTPAPPAETTTETTAVTTTEPAPPAETVTIAAEPVTRTETVTLPAQTLTETLTQTITVQAAPPDPEWLSALAARSQALNDLYALS